MKKLKQGDKIYIKLRHNYYTFEFICLHPDDQDFYIFAHDQDVDLLRKLLNIKLRPKRIITVKSKEEVKNLLENGFTDFNEFAKYCIPIKLEKLQASINHNYRMGRSPSSDRWNNYFKKEDLKEWNQLNTLLSEIK